MKIICTKSDLVHAVSIVSKAVSNNTTLPILKCILIEASTGNIKLTANDMELGIETTIDGQIHQPGKIAIEAKLFSEIVRKLPDNDITIETESSEYLLNFLLINSITRDAIIQVIIAITNGLAPLTRPIATPSKAVWERASPLVESRFKTAVSPTRGIIRLSIIPTIKAYLINE